MPIVVARATKSYGDRTVLRDVSLRAEAGEILCLVGPSGSGKSTLLGAIGGLIRLDSGSVFLEMAHGAHPIAGDKVAWVPQGSNALPHRSAIDNVIVGALSRREALSEATSQAMTTLRSLGLQDVSRQTARTLSGGELQRLCIARAIVAGLPVVLADEPTASLDQSAVASVVEAFRHLRSTATVVVVATHDARVAAAADRCLDMATLMAT